MSNELKLKSIMESLIIKTKELTELKLNLERSYNILGKQFFYIPN